ncbi:MAG: thiamine diphosphokinase [Chloroflexi bacterium]|nr:thiamine diphosphokinase [Chloroflexota bacterium]
MKAIVVAGGNAAPEDAAHLSGADMVIAADSGAQWLDSGGVRPDLVIGDMDSIDPLLLQRLATRGVEVEKHPAEKDASDLDLALSRAMAGGANEVVILGGLGGRRLDHELANVLLLVDRRWDGIRLRMIRDGTSVQALRGASRADLDGAAGDLVTLLPAGGDATGVRTDGLRYPLVGETLPSGGSRGLSNEVALAGASVSLEVGTLLIIETRREAGA